MTNFLLALLEGLGFQWALKNNREKAKQEMRRELGLTRSRAYIQQARRENRSRRAAKATASILSVLCLVLVAVIFVFLLVCLGGKHK